MSGNTSDNSDAPSTTPNKLF